MKPIAVGDLVVQVRPFHCPCGVGQVFKVSAIRMSAEGLWKCTKCLDKYYAEPMLYAGDEGNPGTGIPLQFLKRIPPLDELEGVKSEEKLKEPA